MDYTEKIIRLQDNLSCIRKLAGWTAEDLAEQLGVTKQTISNIETKRTTMTKMQYIALRAVFDKRMEELEDSKVLAKAVEILVDAEDAEYSAEQFDAARRGFADAANAASAGVTGPGLAGIINSIAPFVDVAANTIAGLAALSWLTLKDRMKK